MSREAEAIVNDFSIQTDEPTREVESRATQSFADEAYDEFKCRHERRQDRLDSKHDQVLHPPTARLMDASASAICAGSWWRTN
jgi:hypothetical protein